MADGSAVAKKDPAGKFANIDVRIERAGERLILPAIPAPGMTLEEAGAVIARLKRDEEEVFAVHEWITGYHYLDGAVAFWKAIVQKYGFASPIPTPGFFGPSPPQMLTVKTGPGITDAIQVPWGQMTIPGFKNPVATHSSEHPDNGRQTFVVSGEIERKNVHLLKELVELARQIIQSESIYRGKAIVFNGDNAAPDFIEVAGDKSAEELILNNNIQDLVKVNLWTPIQNTALCIKHGIPIKRGVLLEGHYGTGKSLTGKATARICVENGWTYVLLSNVHKLEEALRFATNYAPSVVFAEDIDRALEDRDSEEANDLINMVDGVVSKGMQVITVLTTNFAEKLDRAMLRPGRLDTVIHYAPPDADAVQALIRLYSRGLMAEGETLTMIGSALAGEIPATIREVVERSKLAMISRRAEWVNEADLLVAADGMKQHLALLKSDKVDHRTDAIGRVVEGLHDLIADAAGRSVLDSLQDKTELGFDTNDTRRKRMHADLNGKADMRHQITGKKLNEVEEKVDNIARRVGV